MAGHKRMDDEEFKRRLTEVAEWHTPTDADKPYAKTKRKKRNEQLMELVGDDDNQEVITDGANDTIAPVITKLRTAACNCEDCGRHCPEGRAKEAKLHQKGDKKVWRQKCLTCKMFQNPFTGEFNLTGSVASIKFNDFMRETKGVYKTRGNEERRRVTVERTKTVIEHEHETITFYHERNTQV